MWWLSVVLWDIDEWLMGQYGAGLYKIPNDCGLNACVMLYFFYVSMFFRNWLILFSFHNFNHFLDFVIFSRILFICEYSKIENPFRLWTIRSILLLRMLGYLISCQNLKPDPEQLQALFSLPIPSSSKDLKRVCSIFAYYAKWIRNFPKRWDPCYKRGISLLAPKLGVPSKS